ncbi:MAG: hypothetical protein F2667_00325 [Actinobacteria bacterium]|nr:hypothetical protein [Actinomycetota bacterium]
MPYTPPTLETDPVVIAAQMLDDMAVRVPGWVPHEGALDVALIEEYSQELAITRVALLAALQTAYAGFGESVHGFPVAQGSAATIPVTITVSPNGSTVQAGLILTGLTGAGVEVAFQISAPVVAVGPTAVALATAVQIGAGSNGVPAGALTVQTATVNVVSAAAAAASDGGTDPETIAAYADRLTDFLSTLRAGGVRAADLAAIARTVTGVERCLALDLYDPGNPAVPAEKTATLIPITAAGAAVSGPVAAAVTAAVAAVREINFVINILAPTFTVITVTFTATAQAGYGTAAVQAAIESAVKSWLSPASWGSTPTDPDAWTNTSTVRYLDLAAVARNVEGVASLTGLTLNGGTADVVMAGPGALPASVAGGTTVTGVVS